MEANEILDRLEKATNPTLDGTALGKLKDDLRADVDAAKPKSKKGDDK